EPSRVLSEAAELMQEQAGRRGLRLEVNCAPGLPNGAGDRARVHQLMLNLIDNAIKYTPREGHVRIEAHEAASANGSASTPTPGVAMVVADSGEAIPAADIPRLTERFYR